MPKNSTSIPSFTGTLPVKNQRLIDSMPRSKPVGGGGAIGAHRALAATATRVIAALGAEGFKMQSLDAPQMGRAIADTANLRRPEDGDGPFWAEEWNRLRVGDTTHRTFLVAGWGVSRGVGNPLDQLGNIRATAVTTSVTLTKAPTGAQLSGSVRITSGLDPQRLDLAERSLRSAATAAHIRLTDAQGYQHLAMIAGLPLGGPRRNT